MSGGHLSDLGRDDGFVSNLKIGNWKSGRVPIAVFEVPSGGSEGMLGLPFITQNRVILDYQKYTATLDAGEEQESSLANDLKQRGYLAHPMVRDAKDGRYLIPVTINGVTAPMVVSTVVAITVDTGFAARAGVASGAKSGSFGGPSGATGSTYATATPVVLSLGDWSSKPEKVSLEDTYAYSKTPRPQNAAEARGGALGADFMIHYGAVIDFGNSVLYLKQP